MLWPSIRAQKTRGTSVVRGDEHRVSEDVVHVARQARGQSGRDVRRLIAAAMRRRATRGRSVEFQSLDI